MPCPWTVSPLVTTGEGTDVCCGVGWRGQLPKGDVFSGFLLGWGASQWLQATFTLGVAHQTALWGRHLTGHLQLSAMQSEPLLGAELGVEFNFLGMSAEVPGEQVA